MPIQQIILIAALAVGILALGCLCFIISSKKNLTTYRQYNRFLSRMERQLDINLSLKKIRFKRVTPILLSHVQRNIGNLALVNNSVAAFYEVFRNRKKHDKKDFIQTISALPDLSPFYDTRNFVDENGWQVAGDILRYFINRRNLFNDRILIQIFGTKNYQQRGWKIYRAYSAFFVTVKIKKGLPEAELIAYPELEFVMKRLGKNTFEGYRTGWWQYRFIVNHDRHVIFYKKVMSRRLEEVRTLENMNYIIENRTVYDECANIREAMLKMAKIQNLNEITLSEIDTMSGLQFQNWCKDALEAIYDVKTTKFFHDKHVDFMIEGNARIPKTVVLVSRQEKSIGAINIEEVQKGCFLHDADKGLIITNGQFSKAALELAQGTQVTLMSRDELITLIAKTNFKMKR